MGIGVAQPGGGDTWHKPSEGLEETYYVLKGKGRIAWKSSDGQVNELEFPQGDALYLPCGVENMFINPGPDELWPLSRG